MFLNFLELILIGLLSLIVYQDFRYRTISLFLLVLIFLSSFIYGYFGINIKNLLQSSMINFAFLLVQAVILLIYFKIRHGSFRILDVYIGKGDPLFLLVIISLFSPINFILYYTSSLFLTLVLALVLNIRKPLASSQIPLAGFFAGTLIILFFFKHLIGGFSLYNDAFLLSYLSR